MTAGKITNLFEINIGRYFSDFTYVSTWQRFAYVALVIDTSVAFTRPELDSITEPPLPEVVAEIRTSC